MHFIFQANALISWRQEYPALPAIASVVKNLFHQGLWGVSMSVSESTIEETQLLRKLVPVHINYLSNAVSEQVRMVLDGKPDSVTIWNDKREDQCYDPQLFAHQLNDAIEPLKLEKIPVRLLLESEPDLVKETHRFGIRGIFLKCGSDVDKVSASIQTARKLGMSVYLAGLSDWSQLLEAKRYYPVTGIVLDMPILRFIFEMGSREAFRELRDLLK